ncbi:glycosyltransferase [Deinococcus sp. QL22]|uniref:glycosyltransferase n=1 Tax=Deinococcus sp. QL22 TaxID=2939437 RepID=UPI002016BFB9|nr:glycosyltransferase [Deinococcus sp. QL22]UQN09752.1 glycosyltransferase [Deinococcus sp. QL22]
MTSQHAVNTQPQRDPAVRRLHIMHIVHHLDLGGSEEVALTLAEQLSGHCDFSVFAVRGITKTPVGRAMQTRLEQLQIPVYSGTTLDMKRGGMIHAGLALRRLLRRVRPDIVHLHTDIPDAAYAASLLFGSENPGLRVIRTIHNTVLWPKWVRIGQWVERRLEHAESVGVSPASLEGLHDFRARHGLGLLPEAQTGVIYNGVMERAKAPAQRLPGPARVLFAGRFEAQKGTDLLPAILERAAELTTAAAEIQMYGQGTFAPVLHHWAERQEGRWPVKVSPPIPQLSALLADYDVVLMPSRHEGLSLLGIEVVLAGTPLVAARINGLQELFPPHHDLLVSAEDVEGFARTLARVIEAPAQYRERAFALIAPTAARFSMDRMTKAYLDLYRQEVVTGGTI